MNQKNYELLHWAVTQHQFVKRFDPKNAKDYYDKVYNSYKRLYDKVVNYCVLNEETAQETIKTSPVYNSEPHIKKTSQNEKEISKIAEKTTKFTPYDKSHPLSSGWHTFRFESVIFLHKIGKTDEEIAKIINSTPIKVRKIINDYEFSQI